MDTFLKISSNRSECCGRIRALTATAIAALTLGIGANTAIFSVVNTVLLKPLPYPEPERIVFLMNTGPQGSFPGASVPKFNVWRTKTGVLEDVTAYDAGGPGVNISGGERPEQVKGIHVSRDFFGSSERRSLLDEASPTDEDLPRGPNVVMISEGLWKRRYASQPGVVGKTLSLGKEPYTIIGIVGELQL